MNAPGLAQVLETIADDSALTNVGTDVGAVAAYLYDRHYRRPGQPGVEPGDDERFLPTLRMANPIAGRPGFAREMATPGHYFMLGRMPFDCATGRQVRFYWNVSARSAGTLLTRLGGALDRRRIRFQCKVPIVPSGYDRADAGVLYVAAEDVAAIIDVLRDVHDSIGPGLRPDVPLFTRRLASGLGFAESPQNGESFGMQRCRLLAEGLGIARNSGQSRYDAMRERLAGFGIRADRPECNPGSAYPYVFTGFE